MARGATHHLENKGTFMGSGCVPDFIHGLYHSVHSSIEADGVVGTWNIVVDGPRHTHSSHAHAGQGLCTTVGALATDDNESLYPFCP